MAEIVTLKGVTVPEASSAEPNTLVVEELERLLDAARAGEIVGLAGSYRHRNGTVTYSYAGEVGTFSILGALDCVKERLLHAAIQS